MAKHIFCQVNAYILGLIIKYMGLNMGYLMSNERLEQIS